MRNGCVDVARFVFAFLVVLIHVPMRGAIYSYPLARCAVPFFFITAGYFCFSTDSLCWESALKKNIRKWYSLWGRYIVSFCFITLLVNYFITKEFVFSYQDIVSFLKEGSCNLNDRIVYANSAYGISTLWFLYAGGGAFLLVHLSKKYIQSGMLSVVVLLLFAVSTALNYNEIVIPRVLSIGLPFVWCGMIIRKYQKKFVLSLFTVSLLVVFSLAVAYFEFFLSSPATNLYNVQTQIFFSTPLLSIAIFSLLLSLNAKYPLSIKLPVKFTLSVYVWHRLVFLLFVILGLNSYLFRFDALVVFVVTIVAAAIISAVRNFLIEKWLINKNQ